MKLNFFTQLIIRSGILLLLVLLQFCKPEKEVSPEEKATARTIDFLAGSRNKTWIIESVQINGKDQILNACEQSAEITFSRDLTGVNNFTNSNCSVSTNLTWKIEEGALSLSANNAEAQILEIIALDNNTFQYQINYATGLQYMFTLKAT